jgi:hypothetical protein
LLHILQHPFISLNLVYFAAMSITFFKLFLSIKPK